MRTDTSIKASVAEGSHAGSGSGLYDHNTVWQVEELEAVIAPGVTVTPLTVAQFMIYVYLPMFVGQAPINHNETMLEAPE
jgi:hypothetical protein